MMACIKFVYVYVYVCVCTCVCMCTVYVSVCVYGACMHVLYSCSIPYHIQLVFDAMLHIRCEWVPQSTHV